MEIYILIGWLLLGIFGWNLTYHSIRKEWYITFNKEYWDSEYHSALNFLCTIGLFLVLIGPTLILLTTITVKREYLSIYFPRNKKK